MKLIPIEDLERWPVKVIAFFVFILIFHLAFGTNFVDSKQNNVKLNGG